MSAYYNEIDPYAAAWLRNLIAEGEIAPGDVDERSIEDVRPDDLRGYTQCHFFAGVGVWSYALRLAGWPDDRPVWTGSCPCQPFSAAGKRGGTADERHLWPAWQWLIEQRRPGVIFGEQVASKDGLGWLDLVCADLEGAHYAIGAFDTCSAGHGAPHIRQRLRFAAQKLEHATRHGWQQWRPEPSERGSLGRRGAGGLADGVGDGARRAPGNGDRAQGALVGVDWGASRSSSASRLRSSSGGRVDGQQPGLEGHAGYGDRGHQPGWFRASPHRPAPPASESGGLADGHGDRWAETGQRGTAPRNDGALGDGAAGRVADLGGERRRERESGHRHHTGHVRPQPDADGGDVRPGPTNGFWQAADWLFCRDGKWRPVEPGTFPLVDGATFKLGSGSAFEGKSRQGMLRGYGNAVDAEATAAFIAAYLEAEAGEPHGGPALLAAQSDIGAL